VSLSTGNTRHMPKAFHIPKDKEAFINFVSTLSFVEVIIELALFFETLGQTTSGSSLG